MCLLIKPLLAIACCTSGLFLVAAAPLRGQADTTDTAEDVEQKGYPVPSLESYRRLDEKVGHLDAVPSVAGAETLAEPFAGPAGLPLVRFTTGGVVWGYTLVGTPGDASSVYFLRDPTCEGVFTEKLSPSDTFGPPPCAVAAAEAAAAGMPGAAPPAGEEPAGAADSAATEAVGGPTPDAAEADTPGCVGLGCGDSVPTCVGMGCPE